MGQIEDYHLFALIVENESISKAADVLNIAKSAVSRRLKLLEERFDTVLIDRQAGHWAITPKGEELYARVKPLIDESEEVNEDFTSSLSKSEGPLRVSFPLHLGVSRLRSFLTNFQKTYPEIRPTFDFDDRLVDLESEDYDLAIRVTSSAPQDLNSIWLGNLCYKIVASPEYWARFGIPETPKDLVHHRIISYGKNARTTWDFRCLDKQSLIKVKLKVQLNSNSGFVVLPAAEAGLGVARLPDFVYEDALKEGRLRSALDDFTTDPLGIYLLRSPTRRMNRRMRLLVEALQNSALFTGNKT